MAITVKEKVNGVSVLSDGSREVLYVVHDSARTADESAALAALLAEAPPTRGSLTREENPEVEEIADGVFLATVRYTDPESDDGSESGGPSASFDTTGGTQHVTRSIAQVYAGAPEGKPVPVSNGLIGISADGDEVAGTDIVTSTFIYRETHILPNATVTDAYIGNLINLTGKVASNATYKAMSTGECLFLGASGNHAAGGPWTIEFGFGGSPNVAELPPIGGITGVAKKGWEYVWVRYERITDDDAKKLVPKPIAVYVEKVYDLADMTPLGIGTTRI